MSDQQEGMERMEARYRGEWMVAKGDKGETGAKGDKGETGPVMPPALRRAIIYLFVIAFLLAAADLFWTSHEVNANRAAQVQVQAAQRKQGQHTLHLLCTTFGALASLKPPAGNPATNPSRAYEDSLHVRLDQLGTDLGCR